MQGISSFARTSFVLFLLALIVGAVSFPTIADASPRAVLGELFTEDG
ncbi:hypothetical protein HOD41_01250 [bacterium]|jgi:hypothetical protein|nr:hypothetical protein [bacterium]MBT7311038.1 hypothetical protein [bacterium]